MSDEPNYISPKHNAYVNNDIPDVLYDKYREAITMNLSNKFIEQFIKASNGGNSVDARVSIYTLIEDVGAYLEYKGDEI